MLWFGKSWEAAVCDVETWHPTPIGELCSYCGMVVTEHDAGVILPHMEYDPLGRNATTVMRPMHRSCLFQQLFGNEMAYEMERKLGAIPPATIRDAERVERP